MQGGTPNAMMIGRVTDAASRSAACFDPQGPPDNLSMKRLRAGRATPAEGTARRAGRNRTAAPNRAAMEYPVPPIREGRALSLNHPAARRARRRTAIVAVLALFVTGCDRFPSDPDHSLDTIRSSGTIRLGAPQDIPPEARTLLRRLDEATGARTQRISGPVEPLLQAVENGKIDLVIAPFRKDTPSATTNALSPPIRTEGRGQTAIEWRAAMRNGENRWISLVEINARRVARGTR